MTKEPFDIGDWTFFICHLGTLLRMTSLDPSPLGDTSIAWDAVTGSANSNLLLNYFVLFVAD